MNRLQLAAVGIVGGIVTIIGAIGSWATYQGQNWAGTDANRGKTVAIAAGIGLILLALSAVTKWRWMAALGAVAGLVSAGLTIWTLSNVGGFVDAPAGISIGKGWGLWVATIGSIVLVLAALGAALVKDEARSAEPQPGAPAA